MTLKYLQCDGCKATLGQEQVPSDICPHKFDTRPLYAYAFALGWTNDIEHDVDLCPECSKNPPVLPEPTRLPVIPADALKVVTHSVSSLIFDGTNWQVEPDSQT